MTGWGIHCGIFTAPGITLLCACHLKAYELFDISIFYLADDAGRGDVWWLDSAAAFTQQLAYVNENNQAVMKVDNSSFVPYNQKRNSIRIESRDWYGVGSLWIADISHVPDGCSVSLYAKPISVLTSSTGHGVFRFGLRSGHTVSCCEFGCPLNVTYLFANVTYRRNVARFWRDRHLW